MSRPGDDPLSLVPAGVALASGMRDLLPPRAQARRWLARTVLAHFERWGYQPVLLPAYEREEVVSLGLDEGARRELVRFLEPESGQVVVLRPDMTPQVARVVATRYRDVQGPLRFAYEGSVVRRPRGRARRQWQLAQAGVELLGWQGADADAEVALLAAGAVQSAGLGGVALEVGHAALGARALEPVPREKRAAVIEALDRRDVATLGALLGGALLASSGLGALVRLGGAVGPVLEEARGALDPARFGAALDELEALVARLRAVLPQEQLLVDLGEVRGLGYYTGVTFQLLARGSGVPLGQGGRYDTLLERFGAARAATGFALDLEALEQALHCAGVRVDEGAARPCLLGGPRELRQREATERRARGERVAECDACEPEPLRALARALGYGAVVLVSAQGVREFAVDEAASVEHPPPAARPARDA